MNYFNQQSERLTFKKLTPAHIPRWIDFFSNNDSLDFLGLDLTKSHSFLAEDWITAQFERYEKYGLGHLAVHITDSDEFIGLAGIIPRTVNGIQEHEIAFSLLPEYWGNGYGTEAAQQLKKFGTNNINTNRFISIIHENNKASMNVALKNGMTVLFQTEYMKMPVKVFGVERN